MNGMQAVTNLSEYIAKNIVDIKVFKFEKPTNFEGDYICLNYLNISYGRAVNTSCIVNVNLHATDMTDSQPDTKKLQSISERIFSLVPCRNRTKLNQIKQSITKQMTFNAFSTKANKRECKQFVCVLLCFVQVVQK